MNFERDSVKELYSGLYSNNPTAEGYLRVEVQDVEGQPLPGFEASNCLPLKQGDLYQQVSWEGNQDLSGVGDREIRLKFILGNARLYSFKLE